MTSVELHSAAVYCTRPSWKPLAALVAGALAAMVAQAQTQTQAAGATAAPEAAAEPPGQVAAAEPARAEGTLEEIFVSARKREESVAKVPSSITVFTSQALEDYNIQSFNDYATKTPNISFSYGGGPTGISQARTVAIRGITGQNLYGTAGATGFYIDDTPIPGSVDPRVLDIANIEVLKGPQGTLFGESSLGGNVRLITKKPDLQQNGLGYMAEGGGTSGGGSADYGGNVIGNLVLARDTLALRFVFFANHDAGYLTRTYPTNPNSAAATDPFIPAARSSVGNQGAQDSSGGSISALYKLSDNFEARLRFMFQDTEDNGFPATFAPLPAFTPDYTLDRAFNVQSTASDHWNLPSLDLKYSGTGWSLVSSSSYFYRHTSDIEDSTYGTWQILTPGLLPAGFFNYGVTGLPAQPFLWDGEHYHGQINEELRLSWDEWHGLSGTVGAFYARTHTRFYIPPETANGLVAATATNTVVGPWPNDELWTQNNPDTQEDKSLFGEVYYKFAERYTLTVGARRYWLDQTADYTADGFMNFGLTPSAPEQNSQSGIDPKFGLAYQATDDAMVYGSASKGFRAGGAQAFGPFCALPPGLTPTDITQLKSDTLWTYELGTKIQVPHPGLMISAAAFKINWSDLQQQVALSCGYYFDINGNKATINGGEIEVTGHVTHALQLRFGLGYEETSITDPGALGVVGINPGSRILGTPAWNGTMGGVYSWPVTTSIDAFASADVSYTGNSVALLNGGGGAESTRPAYTLFNLRLGANFEESEVSLNVHNLTNAHPNLGDVGYVGYAQFSQAGSVIPQVATLQPRTIMVQYRKNI